MPQVDMSNGLSMGLCLLEPFGAGDALVKALFVAATTLIEVDGLTDAQLDELACGLRPQLAEVPDLEPFDSWRAAAEAAEKM